MFSHIALPAPQPPPNPNPKIESIYIMSKFQTYCDMILAKDMLELRYISHNIVI